MTSSSTDLGPFTVGPDEPVLVIAEIGVNHNGLREIGLRHLRAAIAAGAPAVKFQSFRADELATPGSPKAEYQKTGSGESQLEMLSKLQMSDDDFGAYRVEAARLGAIAFSTPFDPDSVRRLVDAGVELMKIPSGELTNSELVGAIAHTGLPTVISTGMSTLDEVESAVALFRSAGGGPFALLHCVSSYPAPLEEMNLSAIPALREHFGVPVGLSDHTIGRDAAVAAVALGADIVEKHFTVDRSLPGPDHGMSMEPEDFAVMTNVLQLVRAGVGHGAKAPVASELEIRRLSRRSIVAARDLRAGTVLSRADLAFKRPGSGISPTKLDELLGRRLNREIAANEQLRLDDLSG